MGCLFFEGIDEIKTEVNKNKAVVFIKDLVFYGPTVNKIAGKLKYLIRHFDDPLDIEIRIKAKKIKDMPTIMVLEYILYYSLKNSCHKISIRFNPISKLYNASFLNNSLVGKFIGSNQSYARAKNDFIKAFESPNTIITNYHYRKLIKNNDKKKDNLNTAYSELSFFLKQRVDYEDSENYCEAITELCANALDHTESDCILSMECSNAIGDLSKKKFSILSVVVSNVSDTLFFDTLKKQHISNEKRFTLLDEALKCHGNYIKDDSEYSADRFYMVSAFQNKISTREQQTDSGGGTGLFKTINNILGNTHADDCYMLSGKEILLLKEDKILPENGSIGFNSEHNYISKIPDEDMFAESGMYFNGTMVYLMLVLNKKEDAINEKN